MVTADDVVSMVDAGVAKMLGLPAFIFRPTPEQKAVAEEFQARVDARLPFSVQDVADGANKRLP